jgi:hypothetical protein
MLEQVVHILLTVMLRWLFQILWVCGSMLSYWGSTEWSTSYEPPLYWLLSQQCYLWFRSDIGFLWYFDATGTNQPVDILHWCITGMSPFGQIIWLWSFCSVPHFVHQILWNICAVFPTQCIQIMIENSRWEYHVDRERERERGSNRRKLHN